MPKRYDVDVCGDDVKDLRLLLARAARENGEVVSVIWQPRRNVIAKNGRAVEESSGYVVVTAYPTS